MRSERTESGPAKPRHPRTLVLVTVLAAVSSAARVEAQTRSESLPDLVASFWASPTVPERDRVAARILEADPDVDRLLTLLREERRYDEEVPRGRILRKRVASNGVVHPYLILVPSDYTPARKWPVRLELHGGMGAEAWDPDAGDWATGWEPVRDQIVVLPAGWFDSMWWEHSQVENLAAILRELRATWNVDEDRVVAVGNSDGAAALFFLAMRTPDRFAGYAGFVGPPDRLARAELRPDGQMHLDNLADQRFHLGYGERDRLVPIRHLRRYMELFEAHGALLDWYELPGQGHSLRLSDERLRAFVDFLLRTRRDPLPDRLSWSTERVDRYARRSWIEVEALSIPASEEPVDGEGLLPRWGTSIQLRGPTVPREPWGRLEVERTENSVEVTTRGVERFRLLLSPEAFDLSRPVRVVVDGVERHDALVQPSAAVLLHLAARDDDRARLFVAELSFEI